VTYLATPTVIADLEVGSSLVYFAGGEYRTGVVLTGTVSAVFPVATRRPWQPPGEVLESNPTITYRPVVLNSYDGPQELYANQPLFVLAPNASALPITTAAVTGGQELLYQSGTPISGAQVLHGTVEAIFTLQNAGLPSEYLPVKLDSLPYPVRLVTIQPLFVVATA
jgi:hypothetical protein